MPIVSINGSSVGQFRTTEAFVAGRRNSRSLVGRIVFAKPKKEEHSWRPAAYLETNPRYCQRYRPTLQSPSSIAGSTTRYEKWTCRGGVLSCVGFERISRLLCPSRSVSISLAAFHQCNVFSFGSQFDWIRLCPKMRR